nr:conotoxin precursor B2 [Conus ebraeus]
MLRLITAAVLVSACLAYPQKRDGAPADTANLQGFGQPMPAMPNMQGMQMPVMPMPGMQNPFLPLGTGFKRDLDENLEKRKHHSKFNEGNRGSEADPESFMNFMKGNGDNFPFANMDSADTADLGNFQPSENEDGKFRFFDKQQ